MLENLIQGFGTIFALGPIAGIICGVTVGIVFGAIPGINCVMAIAIMLPMTFYVDPVVGIIMLLAVYKAGIYGGSISAILINTPGAAAAFLTAQDGFSLTKIGKSGKALCMSLYASVTGEMISTLILIFVAAPISLLSLKAGPIERVYLLLFAFIIVGSVTGESISRGLLSTCLGMLFATVGMSSLTGALRFTFGIPALVSGFTFTPMLIGVLVMPEVIMAIRDRHKGLSGIRFSRSSNPADNRVSFKEYRSVFATILKSSGIGTFIGALPGLGSTTATFLAYGEAKRTAKNPEKFGKGSLKGLAAAESANNAVCGAAMIPMLTLSIPGDDVTALLFGAFLIHGITPGPTIFFEHTQLIYGIFAGFLVTDLFLLVFARFGFKFWIKAASLPVHYLLPCVTVFAFVGAFSANQSMTDVLFLILFTLLGFGMRLLGLNPAAYIMGFILTPMLEVNLDQSFAIAQGHYSMFFTSPFGWIITGLAAISIYSTCRQKMKAKNTTAKGC